jgi:CRP/FNR family transcriptional regulator, dissimilatory nitrate respiration regulator
MRAKKISCSEVATANTSSEKSSRSKTPLSRIPLFKGISEEELKAMLPCLGHVTRKYLKGEHIISAGTKVERFGVLVEGHAHIQATDTWGRVTILESLQAGSPYGVAYACSSDCVSDVDVIADTNCTVESLRVSKALNVCPNHCACHSSLVRNLLVSMSNKNIAMNRRAIAIAPKTARGKILAYLSLQQQIHGSNKFAIPFTHEKLASYLGVDRSTLSIELCALRNDGVIDYKGKHYELL